MPPPAWRDLDFVEGAGSQTSLAFQAADIVSLANNDYMVAFLYKESTAAFTATPSGWTELSTWDQDTGGFKYRASVWYKRAVSEGSSTYTWSWSGGTWASGLIGVWSGAITAEQAIVTFSVDEETTQNAQPVHAGITIARANSGLIFVTFNFAEDHSLPPSGFVERYGETHETEINDDLTVSPGASGTVTGNLANPEWPSCILFELATEAAAGGGQAPRTMHQQRLRRVG